MLYFSSFLEVFLPFAQVKVFIPALLLLGFSVGIVSSFLGIGGAWLVTPSLNILGMPMTYAIGSDIAHIAGKSIFASWQHGKMKNIDYKLALVMMIGTIIGIEIGAQCVIYLEKITNLDSLIRWVYIALLFIISLVIFYDYFSAKKQKKNNNKKQGIQWHKKLQSISIPPMIHFSSANITCSFWLPIFVGLITGILAGFLGIGGGLFRLPALIYLLGCPTTIAVGTDLFEVMISGLYGSVSYAIKGKVDFLASCIMLIGAIFGVKIGAFATNLIDEYKMRLSFGFSIFGCLISIVLKQLNYSSLSSFCIFFVAICLSSFILINYIIGKRRKEKCAD